MVGNKESSDARQRLSFLDVLRGGVELARRAPLIALSTLAIIFFERILPINSIVATFLSDSAWANLFGLLRSLASPSATWIAAFSLLNALIGCWFTERAFEIRGYQNFDPAFAKFMQYVLRFLLFEFGVVILFVGFGVVVAWITSSVLYPLSPWLERGILLSLFLVTYPLFVMLVQLSLFWSRLKESQAQIAHATISALKALGLKGYWFFALTTAARIIAVSLSLLMLRSALPEVVRAAMVAFIITLVAIVLRGVRFQFQYVHSVHAGARSLTR